MPEGSMVAVREGGMVREGSGSWWQVFRVAVTRATILVGWWTTAAVLDLLDGLIDLDPQPPGR